MVKKTYSGKKFRHFGFRIFLNPKHARVKILSESVPLHMRIPHLISESDMIRENI